ncbi:hypothetical protein T06_11705 [Trichinella sp. T6]|nr:hypothetical protein T06_11705 [Trichinella sp. T6]
MVGRYRGFATLLKETVPDVRAVHCVLHRHHLVAKNLNGELHADLKDLENMTVPDWIITPFDIEIENANVEFSLQEKHVEMISADL